MKRIFIAGGIFVAAHLSQFGSPVSAVEVYANAKFRPIYSAECIHPSQGRMLKQFDLFDGEGYPKDQTFYVVRHMGEPGSDELENEIANPVTWDVGIYSGLSFPWYLRSSYQKGYRDDPNNGASAFQLRCRDAGFLINTFQFEHSSGTVECPGFPECRGGPQASLYREVEDLEPIFRTPTSELTLQVYAKLPFVHWNSKPAVGQQYLYAYFVDPTTGDFLAWLVGFYDSRPFGEANGKTLVSHDGVTSFVSSPLTDTLVDGSSNPYATRSPYSAPMQNLYSWTGEKFFRAHLKREQFARILYDVNLERDQEGLSLFSPNPDDWRLYSFGVGVEVGWAGDDPSSEISIGGSWRYFEVYEAYE